MTDRYTSIEEVRAALYPRMARLVQLDPTEHVSLPPLIRWPHWHHHPKRGWYPCTEDHRPGKRRR